jgi:hypothetical protein
MILVFGSLVFTLRKGQHPWDVSRARSLESRYVTGMQMRVDAGGYLKWYDFHK